MPARDRNYEIIGARSTTDNYDPRDDYEYGGYAGGAENTRQDMQNRSDTAGGRSGPQMDNSAATSDLGREIAARGNQQYLAGYLGHVMNGAWTPAQQQLYNQQQQSVAAQHAIAMSGHGFGAVAGADRNAQMSASNMNMLGEQQMGVQRANDMSAARDQYGNVVDSMRGQDTQGAGQLQDQAYNQAQLDDAQRQRNDQMAQFYLNQRYKVGVDQLGANQDYERQNYAQARGQSDLDWATRTRADDQNRAQQQAVAQGSGQALAVSSRLSSGHHDDDGDD